MKTLTRWLQGFGVVVVLSTGAAAQVAPGAAPEPGNAAAAAELERFQVATQLRSVRPELTPDEEQRLAAEFLSQLRSRSPMAAEKLRGGRMDREELVARLGVFLRENPNLLGGGAALPAEDPRERVVEMLRANTQLAATDRERRALADQFIERLGATNRIARDSLMSGQMTPDELRSRLTVFLTDLKTAGDAPNASPREVTLSAIIDAHVRDHYGNVTERLNSLSFRGTVTDAGRTLDFVVLKKRPALLRMLVLEKGVVVRVLGYDGRTAWMQSPGEPAVKAIGTTEAEIAEMAQFDPPLVGYRDRGAEVHREDKPGSGPIVIRLREKDGSEVISTLDPETLTELSQRRTSPAGESVETRFSEHRKVGPLNVPQVHERWVDGKLRSTNRITEVVPEPGLLEALFERPANAEIGYMDFMGALRRVLEQQRQTAAGKEGTK